MAVTLILLAICIGALIFLLHFFVALCAETKHRARCVGLVLEPAKTMPKVETSLTESETTGSSAQVTGRPVVSRVSGHLGGTTTLKLRHKTAHFTDKG